MIRESEAAPRLLASVATLAEAELALAAGADLIDLKDPTAGALGSWPLAGLDAAVALVAGRRTVSATVGDLPPDATRLAVAARTTAATGVDIVKLGFFPGADHRILAQDLAPVARAGIRLVAVLMADRAPDLTLARSLAEAGFLGMMLDTADKASGGLLRHQAVHDLARFVADGQAHGLRVGLAGSLRLDDVAVLTPLGPDFLGFRGALCHAGRGSAMDGQRLGELRRALDAARRQRSERKACHSGSGANIVSV